ncbi:MAG: MarR family transcriptional regulator [Bacteroidetes bacterium]|jgi:chromosome segregation and condensation protein ScpB|nr:MarR family transcriptional regulator [Bacteroidota bacterium]MBT6686931.1 MarR family transcriptional regulator [Bacteroidota bacterium]MBT7143215.1 MarR family transcriptional regulator [Bacteroidota bacterium]MBT7492807.1 MarR family transcriptional regulator [Bacteroidota bacterium]
MDNKEKVLETISNANKPLKAGEISELSGIEKKDIDKAIKALKSEDKICSPKRCFYDINK